MFGHNLSRHTLKGESLREESGMSSDETESSSFSSDDDDNDEGIGARPMSVTDIRREAATNSSPKRPDTAEKLELEKLRAGIEALLDDYLFILCLMSATFLI